MVINFTVYEYICILHAVHEDTIMHMHFGILIVSLHCFLEVCTCTCTCTCSLVKYSTCTCTCEYIS